MKYLCVYESYNNYLFDRDEIEDMFIHLKDKGFIIEIIMYKTSKQIDIFVKNSKFFDIKSILDDLNFSIEKMKSDGLNISDIIIEDNNSKFNHYDDLESVPLTTLTPSVKLEFEY